MVTRIYANAVAKYNEGKLLDAEKLHRLADAEFADAVKMLCDYGYGGGTTDESNYDIDAFISNETSALIDYAETSAPNAYLARILTNPFLYGNAKAYYKARVSGRENAAAVYKMADEEVKNGIARGEYAALPPFMAEALTELDSAFADRAPDPKIIDTTLTRAMYADSAYCARKSKSKSMRAYVAARIDTANLLSALRARALGMGETALLPLLIEGGDLPLDDVAEVFRAEDPAEKIRDTEYEFLTEGSDAPDLPRYEAEADDYLLRIFARDAENMQSLSPFVCYFLAQLAEYRTVKMILTCLKNNARAEILPRLRGRGAI